jgi:hypothetical protein
MNADTNQGIQMFTSNDLLNNNTTLQGIGANSRFQINTRDSSNLQRNLFLEYGNHSQLSTATCGIDCLNDTVLLFSNSTTPTMTIAPSFPDNTNKIATTSFVTSAISNINATTASNIALTSDNTAGAYFIPFSKTNTSSNVLYVDDVTGPLTYNPSIGTLTCIQFQGDIQTSNTSLVSSFSAGVLTIQCGHLSFRSCNITFTGINNTVSSISLVNPRTNCLYYLGIFNNGTGGLTFNTGLGTGIKTTYSTAVTVPPGSYALMTINQITISSVVITIVNGDILT